MSAHTPTPVKLTPEGRELILDRIVDIRMRRIPELRPLLVEDERDERDVAAFEALLAEVVDLEGLIAEAQIVELPQKPESIELGVRVLIGTPEGTNEWVRIVHPQEAVLDEERISVDSPLGEALLGAGAGDEVSVSAPSGQWVCRVEALDS